MCCVASALFFMTACASSQSSSFDPNATETLGRVVEKTMTRTLNRETNPSVLGLDTAGAMFGIAGVLVAKSKEKRADVIEYSYTVRLQDGRDIQIRSEWTELAPDQCVRIFESKTQRTDYPRMTTDDRCLTKR